MNVFLLLFLFEWNGGVIEEEGVDPWAPDVNFGHSPGCDNQPGLQIPTKLMLRRV